MPSAADIITYIGVPLAILGVTPILYTYLKTLFMGFRLRRTLANYDIEASVHSRLLSGIVEIDVPTYQLALYPRDHVEYWSHKALDGSRHGASWQNLNWVKRPIDQNTLQIHFSDRIQLPQASIPFIQLIEYLGDLGLKTNPSGFWDLSQNGLNVLPGTCLVHEVLENGGPIPILVVASPTIEHPASLILRFQNLPSRSKRTGSDLGPCWIRIPRLKITPSPIPKGNSLQGDTAATTHLPRLEEDRGSEQDDIEFVRITRKGIVEKRMSNGKTLPVTGLPFWFTYSVLAGTAHNGKMELNGRPFGYRIRLTTLYFARECTIPISTNDTHNGWGTIVLSLLSRSKMDAIPSQWTEDSPVRKNRALARKFELLIPDKLRFRSSAFRRARQNTLKSLQGKNDWKHNDGAVLHIPQEVLAVTPAIWQDIAREASEHLSPLTSEMPTSDEICVAASLNQELAEEITATIMLLHDFFTSDQSVQKWLGPPSARDKANFLCAMIILDSIADGAYYLSALANIGECVAKWNPVYLC